MKKTLSALLITGTVSAFAGTVLELPMKKMDGLKGWSWGAEKQARFIQDSDGKEALEIKLDQPVKGHLYGITKKIDTAMIAGKRITISADVRRNTKVYQKWQGGKLMLVVKHANGSYDYYGIGMAYGKFDWRHLSRSFDIPLDIVSAELFLGLQGATGYIQYRNLKLEAEDDVLDLSSIANMGYRDPVAGDGKGGWSDQGPENDASKFKWKRTSFGNVPFRLADPAKNGGKAVMTFSNKRFPKGIFSATLDLSKCHCNANYFYILHTLTFPDSYPPVGEIEITGAKNTQTLKIVNRRDVANWWMPTKNPNALPASIWQNGGGNQVGIYLSKFKLNDLGKINKITFRKEAGSGANWIVLAATLSEKNYPLPKSSTLTIKPDKVWKVLPLPEKGGVIANSALDISFLNDGKPTGTYGRVIINKDGHFAFEKFPNRSVRFFSTAEGPATWRGFWVYKPQLSSKKKIEEYVRQLRLCGYNMVRIHFLDEILLTKAEKDLDFNPRFLDLLDFFIAECGKNGIYINLDAMSCRLGYAKGKRWGGAKDPATPGNFKHEIYFRERVRNIWKDGITKLLMHKNPYTGKTLVDDPVIAMIVGYNEQEFGISACKDFNGFLPLWKEFLKKKYKTLQTLKSAWGKDAPESFDRLKPFRKDDLFRADAVGTDVNIFLTEQENGIFKFYKNTLRGIGYKGPVSAMNLGKSFRYGAVRKDFDFISMNGYHGHPNGFTTNGNGVISQESSIGDAGNLIRGFASMRRYLAPYIVTEHLHVFWNKYRYEQGFLTGAYASFQDFDGLTGFGSNVTINPYEIISPFMLGYDPIARTQEVLTAFMFLRGDVATGKNLVRLAYTSDEVFRGGVANDALSTAQSKLILINRFAYTCDAELPLKSKETVIGRNGSAGIILDPWYSSIADTKNGIFHLDSFLGGLRSRNVLPVKNRSNDAKGIYESETGELLMDTKRNYLQINTPRLQGICAEAGTIAKLADFEISNMSTRGNIALVSIDGTENIRDAKRLLMIVATNALNSDMKFDDPQMRFLLSNGKMPILLETGKFEVVFTNRSAANMKAYALGMDGKRITEMPVRRNGNRVEFSLDTAAIPNGPALFFELSSK